MIGYATFEWEGKNYRLDGEDGGDGLFFAFRDKTSAKSTYAGGRYLMTEKPENDQVLLDFNKPIICRGPMPFLPPAGYRRKKTSCSSPLKQVR